MNYGLSDADILLLQNVFAANDKIREVIIFGSRAMGNYKPGSDIDLAVVADDLTFNELLDLQARLEEQQLLYQIDLQNFKKINDPNVINHIVSAGKIFYKTNT